ncbi:hypothetical protein FRC03_000090 [Tulasnella sp. 419]|nr:hypothetical protein FRC03_000090 [Tulasnella sp. 419]
MRTSLVVLLAILPLGTSAFIWPFGKKRFKTNGLIGAGSLGLDGLHGRVAAFGDFDGNQFLDIVSLSEDQRAVTLHLWNHGSASMILAQINQILTQRLYRLVYISTGGFCHTIYQGPQRYSGRLQP